ncbi:hypothetical protein PSTG_18623, partial [Puccinia striiformis f. sp. tritici PST-78]
LIDEPRRSRRSSASSAAPGKIGIDPKTGLPANVLRGADNNLTAKALARLGDASADHANGPKSLCAKSVLSTLSVLSLRPKDETPEEKRERKRLLKEYRNERRIERKMPMRLRRKRNDRHMLSSINVPISKAIRFSNNGKWIIRCDENKLLNEMLRFVEELVRFGWDLE